jgi:biopolymer transport protein ExbD
MKTTLILAAALISLILPVAAQSSTEQQAYEVALSQIRLPRNTNGTIAFKECNDCEFKTKRVSAQTSYLLDGRAVKLEKFRSAMKRVQDRENEVVTILYHLKENRVTTVSVYL